MGRTRVKICGVRDEAAARWAVDSGADALGFVFVRGSARAVEPADAWRIISGLPPLVSSIGVFVNASLETFSDLEEACPTNLAQLQGNEPETLVRQCGPGVIKAVRYEAATIGAELRRWDAIEEVDAILVDGSSGGEGTLFDWRELPTAMEGVAKPLIIAGGLTAENVGEAIRAARPYAVDVSSGVERERGVKDPRLIAAFCEAVRRADAG